MEKIILFALSCIFSIQLSSQCGVSSEGEIPEIESKGHLFEFYKSQGVTLRLSVWVLREDDGSGGVNMTPTDIDALFDEVNENFSKSQISFDPCIRELHDSYRMNAEDTDIFYDGGCSSLNLVLVPWGGGLAQVGGDLGWSSRNPSDITHEIGHMLGLRHTFHNCSHPSLAECVSDFCTTGPFVITQGDGICDTPADSDGDLDGNSCLDAFPNGNIDCSYDYVHGQDLREKDPCDVPYSDPMGLILKNFMSYKRKSCQSEFSAGQILRMCAIISSNHQDKVGTFSNCLAPSPVSGMLATGLINSDQEFQDLDMELRNFTIKDCKVTLSNSTLKFIEGATLTLDNSELILESSSLISSDEQSCGIGAFNGIVVSGYGKIRLSGGSLIEAFTPIASSGIYGDFENIVCIGHDFTLESSSGTAFQSLGYTLLFGTDAIINGAIQLADDNIHLGYNSSSRVAFRSSTINRSANNSNIGLSLFDAFCGLNDETEINGFPYALNSIEGYLRINKSYIEGVDGPGIIVSNPLLFELNNSHLEQCRLNLSTAVSYNIKNNKFNGCGNFGLCNYTASVGGDDVIHFFENNIINASRSGVRSSSKVQTKFLCNDFDETPVQNFNWVGVNTLQGKDQDIPSGNKFTEDADQIGGMSNSVTYNYYQLAQDEILDNYSDINGITPVSYLDPAGCGLIGPDWMSPAGVLPDDPDDPDTKNDCPLGIDCTQDCPLGIDCTQDCPAGIDCTSPCPPGIDCTQDCPPGIDCTVPCPPGVDCTEPCPRGKDCDPVGDPIFDPIIDIIETEYVSLENQKDDIHSAYFDNNDIELKTLVENQSLESKEVLLKYISNNSDKLDGEWLMDIMHQSEYYKESEMVDMITANPVNIYDDQINELIYQSNSFSSANVNYIRNIQSEYAMSEEVGSLWDLSQIEYRQMELIQYALRRLRHYEWKSYDMQSVWYKRMGSIHADLAIADNYFDIKDDAAMDQVFTDIQLNDSYTIEEKNDASEYKILLNVLSEAADNNEKLSTLSPVRVAQLETWANSEFSLTAEKARGILITFYNYEYEENQSSYTPPAPMQFLSVSTSVVDDLDGELSVFPNPNDGNFNFSYTGDKLVNFVLVDITGREVYSADSIKASKVYQVSDLDAGVYIYQLSDQSGNLIETNKLSVVKD